MCTDLARHALAAEEIDPEAEAAAEAERQAAQAAREERRERQDAARQARLEWLFDHYASLFALAKGNGSTALVAALRATLPESEWNLDPTQILAALEAAHPDQAAAGRGERWALATAALAEASVRPPAGVLRAFARLVAAQAAGQVNESPTAYDDLDTLLAQGALWDWLTEAGYPLSSVDAEIRDTVNALLAEESEDADGGQ